MEEMYPATESYDVGILDVGDGQRIHWELAGNAEGKPAVVLHGGPGSGCTPGNRMLEDLDPQVRQRAADGWVGWELTYLGMTPKPVFDGRYADPVFRYTFARIVTHYFAHGCFLEPDQVLRNADRLAEIPGTMIHGRMDLGGPLATAWAIHRAWPSAELIVVDEPGHAPGDMGMQLARATDRYARA